MFPPGGVWHCTSSSSSGSVGFGRQLGAIFAGTPSLRFGKLSILFHQSSCLRSKILEKKLLVSFIFVICVFAKMRVRECAARGCLLLCASDEGVDAFDGVDEGYMP